MRFEGYSTMRNTDVNKKKVVGRGVFGGYVSENTTACH
jgi:hypothetical protein